ncbi:LysR family transcriptional regulator [Enhydrobacter sp.]|jgi:DNA-binding transcriptional LysR family regulator|uniref:LysR family transcriptional regulator n=1 Tax=Enhydrobacter sp. TaxID=1894999 RepID=UPI0026217BB5|nr:LysR family transcriptional regulator [Enhydrobacter sp.]WIM11173.1 MAG: LysR-family transcriptional regulator PtxE, associated with phosphonate utilization [Enhydrobacter sp.]
MIDLEQVRTFVTVIEAGSFQSAATRRGIAQPTVSQHVRKLEDALGRRLVARSRTQASPTPEGTRFLPFARALLRLAARAEASLAGGGLAIGASSNIGIYLLQPFVSAFGPQVSDLGPIDIRIGSNPETARRLEEAEIDIALMEWWDGRPGFDAAVWRDEPVVVIVPPGHPWARRQWIDKTMLMDASLIGGEPGTGTARLLQERLGIDAARLKTSLQLGSTEAVKQAVRAGLGVSVTLASAVHEEIAAGQLAAARLRGGRLSKPLYSIVPDHALPRSAARRFAAFLQGKAA